MTRTLARKRRVLTAAAMALMCVLVVSVGSRGEAVTRERGYVPTQALRVMDTRVEDGGPMLGAEESRVLHLISRVPLGATAVELNITALDATDATNLTVWPAGQARPYTSNLNISSGEVRSNSVIVDLGDLYAVELYNQSGAVDVIVDVTGWFTGDFVGMRPTRMVDTRYGFSATTLQAGADQTVALGGRFGVPVDAKAAAINVTAIGATEPTSIMMWPAGSPKPMTGMVPVSSTAVYGQSAIVGLQNGAFTLSSLAGRVDVAIDMTGWFRADGKFVAVPAQRVVETKAQICGLKLGPGETRTFPVTIAPDVFAAALNISALEATENTYLTVWAAGETQPHTSNLNVMPNAGPVGAVVISELGPGGQVSLFNAAGSVEVVLDVVGTFSGTTPPGDITPCPLPPPPPPPSTAPAPSTTKAPVSWQSAMLSAINKERTTAGLSPLSTCGALNRSAQAYADVLVTTHEISHVGPDGSELKRRIADGGYVGWTNIGENLAAGQGTVQAVVEAWMASPGHRANILKSEYTHVGFGRTKGIFQSNTVESWFWVQHFGSGGIC